MAKNDTAEDDKVVIKPNLEEYSTGRSASGKKTHHSGDVVAETLNAMTLEEVATIGAKIIPDAGSANDLIAQYAKTQAGKEMNLGMKRMNIGNRIRAAVARLEKEEAGSGVALLQKHSGPQVKSRDKRVAAEAKAKEIADKERAKKKAENEAAKTAKKKTKKKASKKKASKK